MPRRDADLSTMVRIAIISIAFTGLAACAPVVVTPVVRDVSALEAGWIVADATNTALAEATRVANVTAAEAAARATSTTAAQLTRDSLAVEQTRAALSLTQVAGVALATDAAAVRTQSAAATYGAQTPAAAAIATQSAVQAAEAAGRQARSESAAEFWAWLRWTTVVALAALAASFCVVVLTRGLAYVVVEYQREQARTAREAFKLLSPGHWAEWQPGDGYRVYPLPGLLDAPPTVIEQAPATPSREHAWRHAVRLFCWWGDRYGFGIRDLGAKGAAVVSDPDWRRLSRLGKRAGVLAEVTLPGKKGRGTAWAPDWNYARLSDELPRLALPYPTGDDPPNVAFAVPTQHHSQPQHNTPTEPKAPYGQERPSAWDLEQIAS